MRPIYTLSIGDTEIRNRLTQLIAIDRGGFRGDTLLLEIQAENLDIPKRGVKIDCEIGYIETDTWSIGTFVVEGVKLKGPPPEMVIRCVAQPQGDASPAALQTTKSERVWQEFEIEGTTFADVVSAVCAEVGIMAKVDAMLSAIQMPKTVQSNESDAAFLQRITEERNGILKFNADQAIFETRDIGRLGSLTIENTTEMNYSFDFSERSNITAVRTKYQDDAAGETKQITVGSGKGLKVIPNIYPDETTAREAATAMLKNLQRNIITANITLPTVPGLLAEKFIDLSGFPGRTATNGRYVCVLAEHQYSLRTGLVSTLILKRPQP